MSRENFADAEDGARALRRRRGAVVLTIFVAAALIFAAGMLPRPAHASEDKARALAERVLPGHKVESIRRLPDLPFYEIWIRRSLMYADLDARVIITGDMIDGNTMRSLREDRLTEIYAFTPRDVPLETALKTVRGNGEATIYVFADPHCAYCKQFERELVNVDNVTIYTVLYPVLGPESLTRARQILCAEEPVLAWKAWMEAEVPPAPASESCNPSFEKILKFGRDHNISTTPTTLYQDGFRLAGHTPAMTVRDMIARARASSSSKGKVTTR